MNIYGNADLLTAAMNGSMLKEKALSQNLANINTPDYKRKDVKFQTELSRAVFGDGKLELAATDENHITRSGGLSSYNPKIESMSNISARRDGNGTTVDVEMAEKAKNAIIYNALVGQVSRKFNSLKSVIAEGAK
ncbi:flagellar basal body rod protein FlgB [Andreesenia angusta]|uniref:Flagellar basal body rod protein FlgB n=1 Tax=Andreesenia angusta TaxID=39480 RepID=A0A1S1VAH8_9FIRM|nr:flagellar basal body rod protein FlgB [Andreesenia angusta]OHW62749.1 flagellar basal body rod protein FlgB [Andreesenia angusta]